MKPISREQRGFTLIELIVVIAIAGVLLAVAAPSFINYLAKQRVEGVMSELGTDLQLARSEAVARNAEVRITFGDGCYVVHTQPAAAAGTACSQTEGVASTMGTNGTDTAVEIKTTKLRAGSPVAMTGDNTLSFIEFEPVRGGASWDGTSAGTGSVLVTSNSGSWQLRVSVHQTVGRLRFCSPNGTMKGYETSCS